MADKQMNQFTTAKDGAYIYAEAADGSQVKISKADLIALIKPEMLGVYGSVDDPNTLDNYGINGMYSVPRTAKNIPSFSSNSSVLFVISCSGYIMQVLVEPFTSNRWMRSISSTWTEWVKL